MAARFDPQRAHPGIERMPDGTVRQVSPITGTVVWTIPGRASRPFPSPLGPARPLSPGDREAACAFCAGRYLDTPPETARLVADRDPAGGTGAWRIERGLTAEEVLAAPAEFRVFPNLFQIAPHEFWEATHGYGLDGPARERWRAYAGTPGGRAHLVALMRTRMRLTGAEGRVDEIGDDALLDSAAHLFGGTHDVVVARRHFLDDATQDDELASCGDLSPDEHHAYLLLTIDTAHRLARANPGVRQVVVFQNWLRPAGASFDHLHRQLVAIDQVGPRTVRELALLAADPQLLTAAVLDPAARARLVIAENAHAIAIAGVGHAHPTIEVHATGPACAPWDLDADAVRAMSDLLHACHAATGRLVPTNEQWHHQPTSPAPGSPALPWRVDLAWRISTPAGFEGSTGIMISPIDPHAMRDRVVASLLRLRADGRIAHLAIGDECSHRLGVRPPRP